MSSFFFFSSFGCPAQFAGSQVPSPGIEPGPLQQKCQLVTTDPPGNPSSVPNNRICIGHVFVGLTCSAVSPHFLPYLFVYLGCGNQSPSPECPQTSSACLPGALTGCRGQAVLVKKSFVHLIYRRGYGHVAIYKKLCFRLRSPNRHCRGCKKEQLCTSPETPLSGMD